MHRRLLADDSRGVGEPLNETTSITPYPNPQRIGDGIVSRGRHVLLLSPALSGLRELRTRMDQEFLPLSTYFGVSSGDLAKDLSAEIAMLKPVLASELPVNVHLMTLQQWQHDSVLVRLSHQFAVEEDAELSGAVVVDVAALLSPLKPVSMTEMTVTANQDRVGMLSKKLRWSESNSVRLDAQVTALRAQAESGSMSIELHAMEVRTFIVKIEPSLNV